MIVDPDFQYVLSQIKYNTNPPRKLYDVTSDEKTIIKATIDHMRSKGKNPRLIRFIRLANGTFDVYRNTSYLGKVQLQGKKKFIQYMKNSLVSDVVYGEKVEDLLPFISKWR